MSSSNHTVLSDRQELCDLIARLCRAIDRLDRDGIVACYAEESYDDHGAGYRGDGRGFADYMVDGPGNGGATFQLHILGQPLFDVDGDEAFGETSYLMVAQVPTGQLVHAVGRYLDHCRRVDGDWKIKYRRVVSDYVGTVDGTAFPGTEGLLASARDKTDPVYQQLRWPEDA
jgi:hypothetical protein